MINWDSIDIKKRNELGNHYWEQGYFHLDFGDKINHKNLLKIFSETMFHTPTIIKSPLRRKGVPVWLSNILKNYNSFNEHIIIRVQKPIFYGIYK